MLSWLRERKPASDMDSLGATTWFYDLKGMLEQRVPFLMETSQLH
jgi:hypothetical protein